MSDFDVSLRIVAFDGTTVVQEFNDPDAGLVVEFVQEPEDNSRKVRTQAPRVDGDYVVAEAADAGDFVAVVRVEAETWGEVATIWQACRAAYRAEPRYYLETEVEGVTTRYLTERPDVASGQTGAENLMQRSQTFSIRWHVQPNPSVSVA